MIHHTQSAQISQKQDERNLYAIMKTMCLPYYYHNDFVATHALGTQVHATHELVPWRAHCFHDCIYIYIYIREEILEEDYGALFV